MTGVTDFEDLTCLTADQRIQRLTKMRDMGLITVAEYDEYAEWYRHESGPKPDASPSEG